MARHRNIRSMQLDDYDYDENIVGSVSDEPECISPTDAQQWIFDRARGQSSLEVFLSNNEDIQEEEEDESFGSKERRDSEHYQLPELNDLEKSKLFSCMDEIRSIIGETYSDKRLVEAIMSNNYDFNKALDTLLSGETKQESNRIPKPKITDAVEKGIGDMLYEKSQQMKQQKETVTVTVTPASKNKTSGFEVNSPKTTTPNSSGRNSPQEDENKGNRAKEAIRNARELFEKERGSEKEQLHLVVIGHVDAGKSTMMGHLLYDLGNVPQRLMHKYEQESKKLGKQSFMYAWVLDETGEERNRGITMDCGYQRFETPTKQVTLLDAPGHKDFIPNMICGANQADVAILVVDATRGEFETGFEQGGQTREHALLVRSLGVSQLCVAINKLDNEKWSQERFNDIMSKLKIFLKQAGFKDSDVHYIPCSGLTGENLVKTASEPELTKWYKGHTLLQVVDSFKVPERAIDKPFRMSISDVFKGIGSSGFNISGRIASGHVCTNDKVIVYPSKEQCVIKNIAIDELPVQSAFAGDQVSITLTGADPSNVSVGFILCDTLNPVPLATKIKARIIVFNVKAPITIGFPVLLHHHSLVEPATVTKLKAQLHKGTGEVIKKNPRCLTNNSCALIELTFQRIIGIEKYADLKEMGDRKSVV